MANSLPPKGKAFPRPLGRATLDRLASFRIIYLAVVSFVFLSVFSVIVSERLLQVYFEQRVAEAVHVDPSAGPIAEQIRLRVGDVVGKSRWVRLGGVEVSVFVLGADGTPLYVRGLAPPPAPPSPGSAALEAERLLPVSTEVTVSVPYNAVLANAFLVFYAALLLQGLYVYQRAMARRDAALLAEAETTRNTAAERAEQIESELEALRDRLSEVRVSESEHAREIEGLRQERMTLSEKLDSLARRERELLSEQASASSDLDSERQALEELLDEALADLQDKDQAIEELNNRLKRASKDASAKSGRGARQGDLLAKRLRTLYKNLEVDDRAVSDLVALRDEGMKLRAEEGLKKLSDDVETAGARRKVGGLPPGLPVFELGFAGKGRIYYTVGAQRRIRILCIGAKNTQKPDLEYLSRIVTRG